MRASLCVAPAVLLALAWGCGGTDEVPFGGSGGPGSSDGGTVRGPDGSAPGDGGSQEDLFSGPVQEPATFAASEVDVITAIRTKDERLPISPLLYGINVATADADRPADVMKCVTFVRRGGDRANAYNWETNVSNGSHNNGFQSDMFLAGGLNQPNAPGELDVELTQRNLAAGRGTMVPFVMNDYVANQTATSIPYDQPGWNPASYFNKVELVKPGPFAATPDPNDGVVYTDEHVDFLKRSFPADIFAPGPTQVMVGTDNEPDLFNYNFPMLQAGSGAPVYGDNGNQVGTKITGDDFTQRFITFAKRVKQMTPNAPIVGPGHYAFDGWTTWHGTMDGRYGNLSTDAWYMDDFLRSVKTASEQAGTRLLDTWDIHWYPQRTFDNVYTHYLDDSVSPMTAEQIDAVLQAPRGYWDPEYDDQSWITDHMKAPLEILTRLKARIEAAYPGTKLGVTEYFPGGRAHVSSAIATVDTLGIFAQMGVSMAAMWPHEGRVEYAYGGIQLLRNADGNGVRFADHSVKVEHPEKIPSSVHAGADDPKVVTVTVLNKTATARRFGIRLFNPAALTSVDAFVVDAAHPDPYAAGTQTLTKYNAYAYTASPFTATMLVFRAP